MINFLKNVQNKPEPVKKFVMWLGVFLVMTVIFMFWIFTFPSQTSVAKNDEAANNLKKELPGAWQSLKGQINNLKKLWPR